MDSEARELVKIAKGLVATPNFKTILKKSQNFQDVAKKHVLKVIDSYSDGKYHRIQEQGARWFGKGDKIFNGLVSTDPRNLKKFQKDVMSIFDKNKWYGKPRARFNQHVGLEHRREQGGYVIEHPEHAIEFHIEFDDVFDLEKFYKAEVEKIMDVVAKKLARNNVSYSRPHWGFSFKKSGDDYNYAYMEARGQYLAGKVYLQLNIESSMESLEWPRGDEREEFVRFVDEVPKVKDIMDVIKRYAPYFLEKK